MSVDICFFDTNILVYFYTKNEPDKKSIVASLIDSCTSVYISTQVINEFTNVMHRKHQASYHDIAKALNEEILLQFDVTLLTVDTIKAALLVADKYKYSYYDSLIVASALECGASILCSEDMHNDHLVEKKLRITNPFRRS